MANRETMKTVKDFIFLGSKITANCDHSHEIKRCLFLGKKKTMTNLDSILKSRDITLPTKVRIQSYGFSSSHVRIWELDHKKAEHQRIDAFELWYWRRLLRAPSSTGRSNQSILKEINPEYSLEKLMLKLKLQYLGQLMWKVDSLEKALVLGKIEAGGEGDTREWDD